MPVAILLLVVVVLYRIFFGFTESGHFFGLQNFSPLAAVALCGAVWLPRRIAIALPLLALLLSDIVLNLFHYHKPLFTFEMAPRYLALFLITWMGLALRSRARLLPLLAASFAGSILFYVMTNTGSWITEPAYAKTFAGWLQCLTVGLHGFPPTWWFYRQTLLSDLAFTALFAMVMGRSGSPTDGYSPLRVGPAVR